jgi:hypothetical protein
VNDNKKVMRDAALECLEKCIAAGNAPTAAVESLLPSMTGAHTRLPHT